MAVASLVCSLVLLAPIALPLGIVALVRTTRTGHRGRGLAIAGISVSGVVLALAVALLSGVLHFRVWAVHNPGTPTGSSSTPPSSANGDRVHIGVLRERDCFTPGEVPNEDSGQLKDFTAVRIPCGEPHRGELYARIQLPDQTEFPGTESVKKTAAEKCAVRLFDYSPDPAAFGGLRTFFYFPERDSWHRGDRTVLCWAGRPQGDLSEPIRQDLDAMKPAQRAYLAAVKPVQLAQARRPLLGPKRDLVGARKWAREVSAGQAQTARMLDEAEIPAALRKPAQELADEMRRGVPYWDEAATAETADAFYTAMRKASVDPTRGIDLERRLRTGLGLRLPDGQFDPTAVLSAAR
ncbi:DUF4190 domain-containing protein [Streptomyces sp. NPDC050418]|uniref:DUF4190 domain-containing protein n=1 Tax=Streptomyces sp. NPDC050418 TaxID=3365612 RepID=UPI0037A0066F